MTNFFRTYRVLAAGLTLLAAALMAAVFGAAALADRFLGREHRFGDLTVRAYATDVSPLLFSVDADSLVLGGPDFRLSLVKPSARLSGWIRLDPTRALLDLRADSAALVLIRRAPTPPHALVFPATLRFPLGVNASWRTLTVLLPNGTRLAVDSSSWRSRGSQALRGAFSVRSESLPVLRFEARARWRGPALRYRVTAKGEGDADLFLSGIREKRDLRSGHDSVSISVENTGPWLPARIAEHVPRGDLRVKADWHRDSVRFDARVATRRIGPIDSAAWNLRVRMGPGGGAFAMTGEGGGQTASARGAWKHPGGVLSTPDFALWTGELNGEFRGGRWIFEPWHLPIDFAIRRATLDTGLRASAHVTTRDGSELDVRWSGRKARRVEVSGDVSATEPWALAWTGDQVAYTSARVDGAWEDDAFRGVARIREPRAYGASADSLEAENEVTRSGYFLRGARIYREGETFTGSGQVLWNDPKGRHAVSLAFEAGHPAHGHAEVAMHFAPHLPYSLEVRAHDLHPARFPYDPARKFAAFAPWVDGRFLWNPAAGTAEAAASARVTGVSGSLDARLDAAWRRDSLRVERAALWSGPARLEASGTFPFRGHPAALADARVLLDGSWRVKADSVNPRDILAMAGRRSDFDGVFNGELSHAVATGLSGALRLDSLHLPGRGAPEITGAVLRGLGDTVSLAAVLATRLPVPHQDTLSGVLSGLGEISPKFHVAAMSSAGFSARVTGRLDHWRGLIGEATAQGSLPLAPGWGGLENFSASGNVTAPLGRGFLDDLRFVGREMRFDHISSRDTLRVSGTPAYSGGVFEIPDLVARGAHGVLRGGFEADPAAGTVKGALQGNSVDFTMPTGQRLQARELSLKLAWDGKRGSRIEADATSGSLVLPPTPYRVETGYDHLRVEMTIPPSESTDASKIVMRGRLHDFFFQRRWGWKDVKGFFTSFNRPGTRSAATRRERAWEVDAEVEAAGSRNRIDTDVLRMTFTGDARVSGVYPYTLIQGKITGLQGEVGPVRQSYALRDFELKWDNATLEDGTVIVEGEKKLRADCRPDTRQTCQLYVKFDGRLENIGSSYETDCGQSSGEALPPSVLINSMNQGCYVPEATGTQGNYGSAAIDMLLLPVNDQVTRGVARASGGFIKSTQVSGLSAFLGNDTTGMESFALEVESRSVHRTSLKGRAAYHPETKLANPWETRLAAEYRPPLERLTSDSVWRARLKDHFTVEAAVESRPENRDIEEERRVSQRAGLRYRHVFWKLW